RCPISTQSFPLSADGRGEAAAAAIVMPVFDRATCNLPQSQTSFIDFFLREMFSRLARKLADQGQKMLRLKAASCKPL
uniref:PDEase domain-containing protein n=1 Tax=Macrostomum lignano TaxID=282301 RepID=A0A1I8F4G7_9PLAT